MRSGDETRNGVGDATEHRRPRAETARPTVLVLADLGQPVYHVGDEAMGIAAADALRARGARVILGTRDVEHSRRCIGADGYVRTLDVPWPPAERERFLGTVREVLAGEAPTGRAADRPWSEEIRRFSEEVSRVDAVLVAGGGNMNSRYGWLLHERAALGLVAAHHGLPLVVSGQTFGPALTEVDTEVLTELLSSARLVLARESASRGLARGLAVAAVHGVDDACGLAPGSRRLEGEPEDLGLPDRYLCATLAPVPDGVGFDAVARFLDRACRRARARVVLLPHMGDPAAQDGDVATHRAVAARMETDPLELPMVHADSAVRVHAGALANLSSRYHPIVFSLAHGVPALGLVPDGYSSVRISGALRHAGLQDFALPLSLLTTDEGTADAALDALLEDVLDGTGSRSSPLHEFVAEHRGWQDRWWDAVAAALFGDGPTTAADLEDPVLPPATETEEWVRRIRLLTPMLEEESVARARAEAEADRAASWAAAERVGRLRAEDRLQELESSGVGVLGPRGRRALAAALRVGRGPLRLAAGARRRIRG